MSDTLPEDPESVDVPAGGTPAVGVPAVGVPAVGVPVEVDPDPGYTSSGIPTFESVREKIETRLGTSTGAVELGSETPEGRRVAEQFEARQRAAADRLEQIRASMTDES